VTLLAERFGSWFLAGRTSDPKWSGRFSIKAGLAMPTPLEFQWSRLNNYLHAVVEPARLREFTFYPEVYYKGLPITPLWWKPDSEGPVLLAHMMPEHRYFVKSPYYKGPDATAEENFNALLEDGWEPAGIGEWTRWLHVDELEKIEGPPPEGAF